MEVLATQFGIYLAIAIAMSFSLPLCEAQEGGETVAGAARKAFDQGAQKLAGGNHAGAISLLKTAVRMEPENAHYHHKLATAFLAGEEYHEMWVHLRKAARLDFGNETFAQDFLRMWRYHDLQGTLNVGVEENVVLRAMGRPDQRIEDKSMRRWIYGFMAVDFASKASGASGVFRVVDLRGYTVEAAREVEQVRVNTDASKWQVAHHQVSRTQDHLELTANGEKIQAWSELFSKQRFPLMSETGATVKGMVQSIRKSLAAVDPNVEFYIISETPSEIHYHWITKSTKDNPAQHEIAKIIKGQKDFYRVAYVKKTERLSSSEFGEWSEVIGNAKLVPIKTVDATESQERSARATGVSNSKLHSWELGKNLALAALIRGKHGPDEIVKRSLLAVSKNAEALNVSVPAPGKLSDDPNTDTAAAIHYLLATAGKPICQSLQAEFGEAHPALFELATKSTLLAMLYQPGDPTSDSLAEALERSVKKSGLETSVWKPLSDKLGTQEKPSVVNTAIKQFQMRVAQAITQ